MKKILYPVLAIACLFTVASCEKNLDIQQKGVTAYEDFYKTDDDGNELITDTYEKYEKRGFFEIDMKYIKDSFIDDIKADMSLLQEIQKKWFGEDGIIKSDPKLDSFKDILNQQLAKEPKRKIIVFTEFADTADYLGKELSESGLPVFKYTSSDASQTNKNVINANFNAGEKKEYQKNDYQILIATDDISEGYKILLLFDEL